MSHGTCASCGAQAGDCIHTNMLPRSEPEVNVPQARLAEPTVQIYVPGNRREVRSSGGGKAQVREVYGPPGDPGPQGKQGPEGRPGRDGKDASVDDVVALAEAHMETWLHQTLKAAVSNAIKELGDLRGPAGKDGANSTVAGPAGTPGRNGADGKSLIGPSGRDGKDADTRAITNA